MEGRGQRRLLKEATEKLRPGRRVGGSQIKATQRTGSSQLSAQLQVRAMTGALGPPPLPALSPPHRAATLTAPVAGPCPGHWTKGLCCEYHSVASALGAQGRAFALEK